MPTTIRRISGPLRTKRLPTGERQLLFPFVLRVQNRTINVPSGFVTDFSTIPFFARSLVDWSKVDVAGVVHDYLYSRPCTNRLDDDRTWRRVARSGSHRANAAQAWLCYAAIVLFAWPFKNVGPSHRFLWFAVDFAVVALLARLADCLPCFILRCVDTCWITLICALVG